MKLRRPALFFAGISLCLASCVTLTQIPEKPVAPEIRTLPGCMGEQRPKGATSPMGSEVALATCQLSHPASSWTEERNGYTVRKTVPFENAELFFRAVLSHLPKAVREKISFPAAEAAPLSAFGSATNRARIQNSFRPIAGHPPVFALAAETNANRIAPVCMAALRFDPQANASEKMFFLALHGRIRQSEWVSVGLFQKPTFTIQPEIVIYLFDTAGRVVFLRRYDKEYAGLAREARLSVAAYYDSLARLLADRQKEIAGDLETLLENAGVAKGENLETAFRKRAPAP